LRTHLHRPFFRTDYLQVLYSLIDWEVTHNTQPITLISNSSKNSLRRELRRKTEEFLSDGGEIKQYDPGETGEPADKPRTRSVYVSPSPLKTRTYVNDVVTSLDSRKKKSAASPPKKPIKRPKKKIIYDDFGEPIREVWVDS